MECLYIPELDSETRHLDIPDEEAQHCRALRLRTNDMVLVSNGKGLCARALLSSPAKSQPTLQIIELLPNFGELAHPPVLVIGMLENKERLEFVLEKTIELGIAEIVVVNTRYSTKRPLSADRLRAKAISAMKQCKRARLPEVVLGLDLHATLDRYATEQIILCDETGTMPQVTLSRSVVFVGPEGGFDDQELQDLRSTGRTTQWKLGSARLRSETAAIAALSCISALSS